MLNGKRVVALTRKELFSAANSPATYGIAVFFLLFTGLWFFLVQRFFALDTASLRSYFAVFPMAFTFVVPALTMKSWAEERKVGTDELLLTLPLSEWELVMGKFLAAYAVILAVLVLTLPVPLTLALMGSFDAGSIAGEYLGTVLLASAGVSAGLLLSSLASSQVGAFLGSVVFLLILTLINQVPQLLDLPAAAASLINYLSLAFHFEAFAKGVVDTRDVAYFILTTLLLLLLNTRVLVYRKWS